MARNDSAENPAHRVGADDTDQPAANRARAGMVCERGDEDAEHDGKGLAEARGQQQREQLGLVADLGQRDDAGGDEQGFQ